MNKTLRVVAWLLMATPLAYLAIAWQNLPEKVAIHFNISGTPDRYGSKNELLIATIGLVLLAALIYFLLPRSYRVDPNKAASRNKSRLQSMALAIAVFISLVACILINSAENGNIKLDIRFVFGCVGILWCIMGNYMYNIKPNNFAGYRTRWTLGNDENWRRTHLLAGKLWFTGGLLIALTCLLTQPIISTVIFLIVTILITIIPGIYSYRLYKRQLRIKNRKS